MPLPEREHPASSCLLWSPASRRQRESLCPHVLAESLCRRDANLGLKNPSRGLNKAWRGVASLQLLWLKSRGHHFVLQMRGSAKAWSHNHPRLSESEPVGVVGARGCSEESTTYARASTLPPWLQKPRPSQRKDGAPAGESSPGGLGHPRPQPELVSKSHGLPAGARPWTAGVPTGAQCRSGSQTHGSAVQAKGCRQQQGPTVATAHPARLQPARPRLCQTQPRPAPGLPQAPLGTSLPGMAVPAVSDKGSRRLDSRGRGHCRAASPLWGPQGPASHPPAGRPLGGTGQQAPVMEEGARKGACSLVPSGEEPRLG